MATVQISSTISAHGTLIWTDGVRATVRDGLKTFTGRLLHKG